MEDYQPKSNWNAQTIVVLVGVIVAVAVPRFRHPRESCIPTSCIAHLKQIDSAKEQWAMDNHKKDGESVQFSDLVGATLYLKSKPMCPNGGEYKVNPVGTNPSCSRSGDEMP